MQFIFTSLSILSAVIYGVLAILSFINGGLSKRSILFSLLMLLGILWSVGMFVTVESFDVFVGMTRYIYIMLSSIMFLLMLFSLSFLPLTGKQYWAIAGAAAVLWSFTALFALMAPGTGLILDVDIADGGAIVENIVYNPMGMVGGGLFTLIPFMIVAIVSLAKALRQSKSASGKRIIKNVLVGACIFVGFILIFNAFFATNHDMHWLGPMSILFVGFIFYSSVIRHAEDDLS